MVSELCGFTSPDLRIQYNANTPTVRTAAEDPTAVLYMVRQSLGGVVKICAEKSWPALF